MRFKVCSKCGVSKPLGEFPKRNDRPGKYRAACKKCASEKFKQWHVVPKNKIRKRKTTDVWRVNNRTRVNRTQNANTAKVKADTMAAYGGHCVCCGETGIAFLTIDHIYGGGNIERREKFNGVAGKAFYLWLKRNDYPKENYQILCHNCNQAKSICGVCPHQTDARLMLTEVSA